jgi:hypothetical protein
MRSAAVQNTSEEPKTNRPDEPFARPVGFVRRAGAFLLREFREILPPTIFFFIGFNPLC